MMNLSSIPVQSAAVSHPQFHDSHPGESASAAEFDRWTISLSAIDSFLRGKGCEAVENIAERMCRRAEYQQGTKSFNLGNLKKDFGACGLPVDSSHGRSKEQKVKIITGLILRLQTEANSGIAERPLGHSFCALMKQAESSIAEGMQQLLDEVNGHFASDPLAMTKPATHDGDGKGDDLAYQHSKQPSSFTPTANPAVTPVAPPPSYDVCSSETGTKLALKMINHRVDGQTSVSRAKSSNPCPAGDIIENLDAAENLIITSESDPYGFSEKRALEAKGYLEKAIAQCEKLHDKDKLHELLDRHRSMGTRLQKLAERKGEIILIKVEELFNKANAAIDCFSSPPKENEVREVASLSEKGRLELKELSGSNYDPVRTGWLAKFDDLNKKLEPYKDKVSDSQQATATSSKVKDRSDPLKKEFDEYWTDYTRKSKDLEEQVLICFESEHPRELRLGKMEDLREFYMTSLEIAGKLRLEKFAGKPAYNVECQILLINIDHMRTQIEVLDNRLSWLKQKEQQHDVKPSSCKQS